MNVVKLVRLGSPAAKAYAAIEAELFTGNDPWPRSVLMVGLATSSSFYVGLIIEVDGDEELCGYAGITKLGSAGATECEVHTIGVEQEWQRWGSGAQLMGALMAAAAESPGLIFLEVCTDNEPTVAMCRRYSFENMGLRKNYYPGSRADAYTMCRPVSAD